MSNELFTIHDILFKKSLENPEIAKDFFTAHLPPSIQKRIDLNTLKVEKGSFVDKHYKNLSTDMLFSAKLENGNRGLIYLLAEHQSREDKLMPLRLLQYVTRILYQYQDKKTETLPIVIPLVYYHGRKSPYPYSTDIMDCFSEPELAKAVMFKPFLLIDMTIMEDTIIKQHQHAAVMEMLQKHFFTNKFVASVESLLVTGSLELIAHLQKGEYLMVVFTYIFQANIPDKEKLIYNIAQAFPSAKEKIMNMAEEFRQEGEQRVKANIISMAEQFKRDARQESSCQIAKALLEQGVPKNIIAKATQLSEKELEKLAKELSLV